MECNMTETKPQSVYYTIEFLKEVTASMSHYSVKVRRKGLPQPVHCAVRILCRSLLIYQSLDTDRGFVQKNIQDHGGRYFGRLEARHFCPTSYPNHPLPQVFLSLLAYSRPNLFPPCGYEEDICILRQSIAA